MCLRARVRACVRAGVRARAGLRAAGPCLGPHVGVPTAGGCAALAARPARQVWRLPCCYQHERGAD
eukprot:13903875-Alexandrium_andersonii.AAC.1